MDSNSPEALAQLLFDQGFLTNPEFERIKARIERGGAVKRFTPPDLASTEEYFRELGDKRASDTSQDFWDYYESKGWTVGQHRMKDWKAAARRWFRNNGGINGQSKTGSPHNSSFQGASKSSPRGIPSGASSGGHNLGELFRRKSQ